MKALRDYVNSQTPATNGIGDSVRQCTDKYFKLTADIDLQNGQKANTDQWEPIGAYNKSLRFNGKFDGGGHVISGLYTVPAAITNSGFGGGLFGCVYTGGVVKNLGVTGRSSSSSTSMMSTIGGIVDFNEGTVSNCCSSVSIMLNNASNIGGVVGNNSGTVTNCYFRKDTSTNSSLKGIGSGGGSDEGAAPKSSAEFASGEVAWLLQNGQEAPVWGQLIDAGQTGEPYEYPVLIGEDDDAKKVCQVTFTFRGGPEGTPDEFRYVNSGGTVSDIPTAPEGKKWEILQRKQQLMRT